jgi:tetratricopeptide (TPR) repeat protein
VAGLAGAFNESTSFWCHMKPHDAIPADLEPDDETGHEHDRAWRGLKVGCVSGLIGSVLVVLLLALGVWYALAKSAASRERQGIPDGPDRWNNDAWMVVRSPRQTPEAYAAALKHAEAAVQAAPDNGYFINTLGVAQYRMGQYAEALETLTKSDKLNATKNGSIPADVAFLAMVRYRLGQKEEANAMLVRLSAYLRDPRHIRDREAYAFLREAEELIEGEAAEQKE